MVWLYHAIFVYAVLCLIALASGAESDGSNTCVDAGSCEEPVVRDTEAEDNNLSSPWAFMNAFSKVGSSWNHVIGEFRSVVKGADGWEEKGDIYAQDMDEGLKLLQSMANEAASASKDAEIDWSFQTTPLKGFGKTVDDVLLAFLRWSVVDKNAWKDNKSCPLIGGVNDYPSPDGAKQEINVSKAFRRLTSYINWMKSVSSDLVEPLTLESISPSLSTFSIHITHDACGRLIWWVNLGKTDLTAFKSKSTTETVRLFVWVAHLLFLDEGAQTKGLLVVDDMSQIGFFEYMTMLPVQVGISVDRFLISVTPLKAKNVVLMDLPRWAEIGYGLLSFFLTSRMKSRVTIVSRGDEDEVLSQVVGGTRFIPSDFGDAKGDLTTDIIEEIRG